MLRLNMIVSAVFAVALAVTLYFMLQQAARDIQREVSAGVEATREIMVAADYRPEIMEKLTQGNARHVELEIIGDLDRLDAQVDSLGSQKQRHVPGWFRALIPGIQALDDTRVVRSLPDGRVVSLRADTSDELNEVWESFGGVVMLFLVSALLSNIAIYLGVRQGIRPIAHFLAALDAIQSGDYAARLKTYAIGEVNELADHFNRMAKAVEQAELENRRLSKTLMEVREQERAYLARELHDDLGQYLTGIQAQAYLVRSAPERADKVARAAEHIADNCDAMQKSFRRLVRDLHPVILQQLGLGDAIRAYAEDWGRTNAVAVSLGTPPEMPSFRDDYNTHLYRIVQEALNNVARHADANQVSLRMDWTEEGLAMDICDNGQGIRQPNDGMGIRSLQERARCVGGTLAVEPGPDGGICVRLRGACLRGASG